MSRDGDMNLTTGSFQRNDQGNDPTGWRFTWRTGPRDASASSANRPAISHVVGLRRRVTTKATKIARRGMPTNASWDAGWNRAAAPSMVVVACATEASAAWKARGTTKLRRSVDSTPVGGGSGGGPRGAGG